MIFAWKEGKHCCEKAILLEQGTVSLLSLTNEHSLFLHMSELLIVKQNPAEQAFTRQKEHHKFTIKKKRREGKTKHFIRTFRSGLNLPHDLNQHYFLLKTLFTVTLTTVLIPRHLI